MICKKCGEVLSEDSMFCNKCGSKTISDELKMESTPKLYVKSYCKKIFKHKKAAIVGVIGVGIIVTIILVTIPSFFAPVNSYFSAIKNNSYEEAKSIYNSNIRGQMKKETDFESTMKKYIQEVQDDCTSKKIDFAKAESLLNAIIKSDAMTTEAADALAKITQLNNSRIAFESGATFEKQNNIKSALSEYSNVIQEDSNYSKAQEKITSLKQQYKTEILEKANTLAENKNYTDAIKLLKDALIIFQGDVELSAACKQYETQNIDFLKSNQDMTVEKAYLYKYGYSIDFYGLSAIVKNNTSKVVKEFTIGFLAYDKDGYPLKIASSGVLMQGKGDTCNIQPGKTYGDNSCWSLYNNNEDKIKTVMACVINCKYYDDTTWENPYYSYWLDQYQEKSIN